MRVALALIAILTLTGCSITSGRPIPWEQVEQFKIGKTTMQQAIAVLGQPTSRAKVMGQVMLGWGYSHTTLSTSQVETFTLIFDAKTSLLVINPQDIDSATLPSMN